MQDDRIARLSRLQAQSGLAVGVFLVAHLIALVASSFGPGIYDAVQGVTRRVYTFWPVELALLGCLALHLSIGLRLAWRRRKAGGAKHRPPLRLRLHRYAAYFLTLVIVGHIAATRLPDLLEGAKPGFTGLSFTLWHLPLIFYPYYFLLALAGLYHLLHGTTLALGRLDRPLPGPLRKRGVFWTAVAISSVACVLGWLSLGGHLYEIPDPRVSKYAKVLEAWGYFGQGATNPTP
jgi:succinate dehydrogenase/fumarate reductase cytochrome b subunit